MESNNEIQPFMTMPRMEDFLDIQIETQNFSSLNQIYNYGFIPIHFNNQQDLESTNKGFDLDDSVSNTKTQVATPAELGNVSYDDKAIVIVDSDASKKITYTVGKRTSIYRGVTKHRWTGRYEAHLWDNKCKKEGQAKIGRQVYLGGYDKEEKAARAYDLAALKYWGQSATINFPVSNYAKELEEMQNVGKQEYIASLRRNSSAFSRGASIYRGVSRHRRGGKWQAKISRVAGKKDLYLGTFDSEEEAAEAYDIAAIKFRGANTVTNFEISRYDVEAISSSSLPVGEAAKQMRFSKELEKIAPMTSGHQTHSTNVSSTIDIPTIQPLAIIPNDLAKTFYDPNPFHLLHPTNQFHPTNDGSGTSEPSGTPTNATTLNELEKVVQFYMRPHQSY